MSEIGLNTIITTASPSPRSGEQDPEKVRAAAQQFEALMIEQMLKSARASGSGDWSGTSDDETGSTMCELAEQQFAQALASGGGLGLAKMIVAGLERK
jgi:peptidoglycan hydrolase FlgJ